MSVEKTTTNTNTNKDSINNLDTNWIDEFEEDSKYSDFYTELLPNIKCYFVYVNRQHKITNIREDKIELDETNIIKKEKLLYIIKNNIIRDDIKYKLLSLLIYNIDLTSHDLRNYLEKEPLARNMEHSFLHSMKYLDDIKLTESITLFHDINSLYFVFFEEQSRREKLKRSNAFTKKIRMTPKTSDKNEDKNDNKDQITTESLSKLENKSKSKYKSINFYSAKNKTRKRYF